MKTVLSYGMGIESSALIAFWAEPRALLDFDLAEDLIVLTAQTGDEPIDVKIQVEKHILPRLRAHGIRYVQVARAGHHESDGIVVLDDTREPYTVHLDGAYKLSDELRAAGTLPQYAGEHRCSLKFKKTTWKVNSNLKDLQDFALKTHIDNKGLTANFPSRDRMTAEGSNRPHPSCVRRWYETR